jgi:hypothetical protein
LKKPIKVRNVDGTFNRNGAITERCLINLEVNDKIMTEWFYVTALGDQDLILGLPWLEKHNPIIDWMKKTPEFQSSTEDKRKHSLGVLPKNKGRQCLSGMKISWYGT